MRKSAALHRNDGINLRAVRCPARSYRNADQRDARRGNKKIIKIINAGGALC